MADTTQVPPPGNAPAYMPPPPPGTGLTQPQPAAVAQQAAAPQAAAPQQTASSGHAQSGTPARTVSAGVSAGLIPQLIKGAIWGPIAIGAGTLLAMWASALAGNEAVRPLRLLTSLTGGGAALVDGSPILGIIYNVVFGLVLGVLFAVVAPRLHGGRAVLIAALVYGVGIFVVDVFVLSPLLSPLWELRNNAFSLAERLIFGAVLALGFIPGGRGA